MHRVREPDFPKNDLDAFIAWVEHMNADMLAAALELEGPFDLVHSHDWLVADAAKALARRFGVPWLVTVHATEYGRHQGGSTSIRNRTSTPSSGGWCAPPTA